MDLEIYSPKYLQFKMSEIKKTEGRFCCAIGCKNKPHARKAGLCHKHFGRRRKIMDPVYDRYVNFKNNAVRRSKDFRITLQEFRDFCQRTGYIVKKGMRGRRCTIDRIRNQEGYYIGNLQILTIHANVDKYHKHDKHFTELPPDDEDYTPF